MEYVRQLLIKSKNVEDIEFLRGQIQKLSQITYVQKITIMESIHKGKYDYIYSQCDFTGLLYFSNENSIEAYCNHPIHVNLVKVLLKRADVTVVDYLIKE